MGAQKNMLNFLLFSRACQAVLLVVDANQGVQVRSLYTLSS
jgi:hypothetical protein